MSTGRKGSENAEGGGRAAKAPAGSRQPSKVANESWYRRSGPRAAVGEIRGKAVFLCIFFIHAVQYSYLSPRREPHVSQGIFKPHGGAHRAGRSGSVSGRRQTAPCRGPAVQHAEKTARHCRRRAGALGAERLLLRSRHPPRPVSLPRRGGILLAGGQRHGPGGAAGCAARYDRSGPVRRPRRQVHPAGGAAGRPGAFDLQ